MYVNVRDRTVCEGDHVCPTSQQTLHPVRNLCLDALLLELEHSAFENCRDYKTIVGLGLSFLLDRKGV